MVRGKIVQFKDAVTDYRDHRNESGVRVISTGHAHPYPYCLASKGVGKEMVCTVDRRGFEIAHTRFEDWMECKTVRDVANIFNVWGIQTRHYQPIDDDNDVREGETC